jgi:hypothetical protein
VDRKQARAFEGFVTESGDALLCMGVRLRPGIEDQTFENPKTGAVLETAFVYKDGTKGTDLYLSVTSRSTLPPNPYRR